jgi:superfamily II DNA or RNA helicase
MAARSKKQDSQTLTALFRAYRSGSKLRSQSRALPANYSWKRSRTIGGPEQSRVSWKALVKQSPWLKQLRPHQVSGVKATAKSTDGFAILFAQRTGKTWVTGGVFATRDDRDILLVGPKTNLESTWGKFFREKMGYYTVCRSLEEYLEHKIAWVKAWGDTPDYCVLMLNPEAVTPLVKHLRKIDWDILAWDEAQRLKNRNSRSSKDAYLLAKDIPFRLALTGTPMDLSEKDLWAIMRFVNVEVFGDSWKDFEDHFLEKPKIDLTKKMGMVQRQRMMLANAIAKRKAPLHEEGKKQFAEMIRPHMMRVSKEDAGIVPAKMHQILFDLEGEQATMYRQLEKTMVVHAGQRTTKKGKKKKRVIKTALKIVQIGKLQQITGGHIKDEDGNIHAVGYSKKRQLRDAIERYAPDEPFVIFVKYVWEIEQLERMLRAIGFRSIAKLWGKVKDLKTDKRRTNMLLAFQQGKFDVMICQQKTGGVGVDLYRARKFFVYSMGHSFIDFDQMLSRGDFLEQSQHADYYFLLARSSIDTDIFTSVLQKKSITEIFYGRVNQR